MRTRLNGLKWLSIAVFTSVIVLAARQADAQQCINDVDCPDAACGGQVCDWLTKAMTCQPAGTGMKGQDGWCTIDTDCKCNSRGATCKDFFCTFTRPQDAPGATGGASGAGGSTGTGGSASTGTGGSASTGTGGSAPPASGDSGGCAVAGMASSSLFGAAIAFAGLVTARRRRNRA